MNKLTEENQKVYTELVPVSNEELIPTRDDSTTLSLYLGDHLEQLSILLLNPLHLCRLDLYGNVHHQSTVTRTRLHYRVLIRKLGGSVV